MDFAKAQDTPIYFSKIEFDIRQWKLYKECSITEDALVFLNLPQQELSFQIMETRWNPSCNTYLKQVFKRVGKNGIQQVRVPADDHSSEIVFSKGIRLTDAQMNDLLPLCNALDFEPFRDRELAEYWGGRDIRGMWFWGITDSYLPKLELRMECWDEKHP